MSEKPVVSAVVNHEVPCGTGRRRLVFTIRLDRCLNGYEGEQLSIEVSGDTTPDALAVLLAERTAWKIQQQTGILYGLHEITVDVQAFAPEEPTVSQETSEPVVTVQEPENQDTQPDVPEPVVTEPESAVPDPVEPEKE